MLPIKDRIIDIKLHKIDATDSICTLNPKPFNVRINMSLPINQYRINVQMKEIDSLHKNL